MPEMFKGTIFLLALVTCALLILVRGIARRRMGDGPGPRLQGAVRCSPPGGMAAAPGRPENLAWGRSRRMGVTENLCMSRVLLRVNLWPHCTGHDDQLNFRPLPSMPAAEDCGEPGNILLRSPRCPETVKITRRFRRRNRAGYLWRPLSCGQLGKGAVTEHAGHKSHRISFCVLARAVGPLQSHAPCCGGGKRGPMCSRRTSDAHRGCRRPPG